MNDFERQAVMHGLQKLFSRDHFSICDLEKLLKVANACPPKRDLQALQLLHCMHWNEMAPAFREAVAAKIVSLFQYPGIRVEFVERQPLLGGVKQLQISVGESVS